MNPYCPECGTRLLINVIAHYTHVPAEEDGYLMDNGMFMWSEITKTYCPKCGWEEEGSDHYHSEETDG